MSGYADTIRVLRYVVAELRTRGEAGLADALEGATSQLVDDVTKQADRIAWLEGEVAGWRIKLAAAQAENKQQAALNLQQALELGEVRAEIGELPDGTPSEDA